MKALYLFAILFTASFSQLQCSEKDPSSDEQLVMPIKELKIEELDFDKLPKESQVGALAAVVNKTTNLMDNLVGRIKIRANLHPYAEGLAYVNGWLCHVGNYPQSIIYTVLEGPHYGMQTTLTYDGIVLYVNYDYTLKSTPDGVILRHRYSDSKVITGSNQVIIFN